MEPLAYPAELKFREEATRRSLLDLAKEGDQEQLLKAALLLNTLWHQQTAISRWLANEAMENLADSWEALRTARQIPAP